MAGYDVLGVSGGEPLLYPGLERILTDGKRAGLTTTITTNGLILTERRLGQLADCADLIAISLDGMPASHNRMRGSSRAFERMSGRLPALRRTGIPFGFVFTLTQWNAHELDWVAGFAEAEGASLLQVHPLELEGFAEAALPDSIPDGTELLYATAEALRLRMTTGLFVQLDVTSRSDLLNHPQRFLALAEPPAKPLGHWLSPLVLEADGTLVPITYGFPHRYAIGNLANGSFAQLTAHWDATALLKLASSTWRELTAEGGPQLLNWYEALSRQARREAETGILQACDNASDA